MGKVECGYSIRPLNRYLSECGDTGRIYQNGMYCYLALMDVLGHGSEARTVAIQAEKYLDEQYDQEPPDLLLGLHSRLTGTRGCVAAVCRVHLETGSVEYSGIGNITTRIIGVKSESLISRDGIIGYRIVTPISFMQLYGPTILS